VVGVQIEYDVVHLRTSLVQLFALLRLNFEEIVQIIELRRFGGSPNGYPSAALPGGCFRWWRPGAGGDERKRMMVRAPVGMFRRPPDLRCGRVGSEIDTVGRERAL
jgi:hypothetical protein